jgi:hypothetical protein
MFQGKDELRTRLKFTSYRFLKRLGVLPLQMNMLSASDVSQLISSQDFNILRNEKLFLNGMTISFIVAKKAES